MDERQEILIKMDNERIDKIESVLRWMLDNVQRERKAMSNMFKPSDINADRRRRIRKSVMTPYERITANGVVDLMELSWTESTFISN